MFSIGVLPFSVIRDSPSRAGGRSDEPQSSPKPRFAACSANPVPDGKATLLQEVRRRLARRRIGRKVLLTIMTRQIFPVEDHGHLRCRHPEVLAVFGEPR